MLLKITASGVGLKECVETTESHDSGRVPHVRLSVRGPKRQAKPSIASARIVKAFEKTS